MVQLPPSVIGKHYTIYASINGTTCVSGAQHSLQVAHLESVLHEGGRQCMAAVGQGQPHVLRVIG